MKSVSTQQHAPPFALCPFVQFSEPLFSTNEEEFRWLQFGEPPAIPLIPFDESSSSSDIHLLRFTECPFCMKSLVGTTFHFCKQCRWPSTGYHKECLEPTSKHPYHPKHSLLPRFNLSPTKKCLGCSKLRDWVYGCSICDFTMCADCAREPLLVIDHPKRHEHKLFFLPRKGSLICEVCALNDIRSLMYICLQCDFVVHKECVYFPCTIRISRHEHRITFNSSLTPEKLLCGVCRGRIDTNYGRYSCVKGCSYGVHSKCATREDVWDGKELEGVPEDAYEDTKSFKEISDGVIQHFSHQNHHMRLDEVTNRPFDENKRCQACALPICDDIIYNCMECDFTLHQGCAYLPRKKQHALHPHPLSLHVGHQKEGWFVCETCRRASNSFMYSCGEKDCNFILDVCCASVSVPLDHCFHPHTLFLTITPFTDQVCSICVRDENHCLNCGDCEFVLCFGCATLPKKLKYKYDEHYLSFSYDKDATCQYLCDACEKDANPKKGVYMCNVCNITLHIKCLLGENMYMRPGGIIDDDGRNVDIIPNNHLTRSKCRYCHKRCKEKVVFKLSDKEMFCSLYCL